MLRSTSYVAVALFIAQASPVLAQAHDSRQALLKQRIEELGRYGAAAPNCVALGYSFDERAIPIVQRAAIAELMQGGLLEGEAAKVFNTAVARHADEHAIEMARLARASARSGSADATGTLNSEEAALCRAAAVDPVFSRAVMAPGA